MKANLTLEDIGRLAGVSRSTVSRVINDQGNVKPDVRQRVLEVIGRTGYTPNAAARSLVSGRSGLIGLVIPSRVHSLFEDPYFGRLIQGISAATNRAGMSLTLFLLENEADEETLYPQIANPGFLDGVLVTATRMRDPLLAQLAFGEIPVVVIGHPDIAGMSYVDVDNHGGARSVARYLCELGYRRLGLIGAPNDTMAGLDRLNGFVQGLAEYGIALDPSLRYDGDFSEASGHAAMARLIPERPDAVFAASDTMALGALRAIRDAGLRVPDDIALVGFDGSAAAETTNPPLTTALQDVHESGRRAVAALDRLIADSAAGPIVEILPVELIVRTSTALHRAPATDRAVSGQP